MGATPSWHCLSLLSSASHFARHASLDWVVREDACEGLLSCADAGIIKESTSAIAKYDILVMTGGPHLGVESCAGRPLVAAAKPRNRRASGPGIELTRVTQARPGACPFQRRK